MAKNNTDFNRIAAVILQGPGVVVGTLRIFLLPFAFMMLLGFLQYNFFPMHGIKMQDELKANSYKELLREEAEREAEWRAKNDKRCWDRILECDENGKYTGRTSKVWGNKVVEEVPAKTTSQVTQEVVKVDCSNPTSGYETTYCATLEQERSRIKPGKTQKQINDQDAWEQNRDEMCAKKLEAEGYAIGIGSGWAAASAKCIADANRQRAKELRNGR